MARRPGTSVYRASVRGAGASARAFDRLQREIQDELVREMRELGRAGVRIFRGSAPEDTGDLREGIDAVPYFGRAGRPRVEIRVAPLEGHRGEESDDFDHLDVSRFGHRAATVEPRRGRMLKVHYAGHRNAEVYAYMPEVRGARPAVDWVEVAAERMEREIVRSADRLGRRVESRIL